MWQKDYVVKAHKKETKTLRGKKEGKETSGNGNIDERGESRSGN